MKVSHFYTVSPDDKFSEKNKYRNGTSTKTE